VKHLLRLIFGIALAFSLGAGAVAHSMEPFAGIEIDACAHPDSDAQDANDPTSDSDKSAPHLHGACHAHHIAQPASPAAHVPTRALKSVLLARDSHGLMQAFPTMTLRPPIA